MNIPLTAGDAERLEVLQRYEILDTPPEDTFDRVVEIIAAVFGVPIALITFVDRERSWFKAKRGLPISQLDRADAMCDTVIRQDGVYVMTDAAASGSDEVGPLLKVGLRFYAAAPLRTSDGCKVGTVCAAGTQPR